MPGAGVVRAAAAAGKIEAPYYGADAREIAKEDFRPTSPSIPPQTPLWPNSPSIRCLIGSMRTCLADEPFGPPRGDALGSALPLGATTDIRGKRETRSACSYSRPNQALCFMPEGDKRLPLDLIVAVTCSSNLHHAS